MIFPYTKLPRPAHSPYVHPVGTVDNRRLTIPQRSGALRHEVLTRPGFRPYMQFLSVGHRFALQLCLQDVGKGREQERQLLSAGRSPSHALLSASTLKVINNDSFPD